MKYVLTIVVIIILGFVGYSGLKNSSLFQVKIEKPVSVSEEWPVYKNSKYGLEFSHPSEFVAEENGATFDVHLGSTLINRGNIFIKVFDTTQYKIMSLDDISYVNKGATGTTVVSSKGGTNDNGIAFREIKSAQNSSTNSATILFLHNNNAYEFDWNCWPSKPCFDDATLEKMIQSIKFGN